MIPGAWSACQEGKVEGTNLEATYIFPSAGKITLHQIHLNDVHCYSCQHGHCL
jgi:hypothetical protein